MLHPTTSARTPLACFRTTAFGMLVGMFALGTLAFTGPAHAGDPKKDGKPEPQKEAPAVPSRAAGTGDAAVDDMTADYERKLGVSLRAALRGRVVVRGDNEQADLDKVAVACERTLTHFMDVVHATPNDVFGARAEGATGTRVGPVAIEVFQFVKEKGYLNFLDKLLARIRDETVDDKRLALMRRQRGFFIQSPRYLMAQYQGPSEIESCVSQGSHKTSHICLLAWKRKAGWQPWWLLEGFAVWQEIAIFGESRTYCLEVETPGGYDKQGTPEADVAAKALMEERWRAKVKAMIRDGKQVDLGVLGRRSLNELSFDDVVQSWSVVTWLAKTGKLPAFLLASKEKKNLDETCSAALDMPLAAAEAAWTAWAK